MGEGLARLGVSVELLRGLRYRWMIEHRLRTCTLVDLCQRLQIAAPHEPTPPPTVVPPPHLWRVQRVLRLAQRLDPSFNCLRRALLTGALLRDYGPKLCIGVAPTAPSRAHAWITVGGLELGRGDLPWTQLRNPARLTDSSGLL